jgi:hypothetical protein
VGDVDWQAFGFTIQRSVHIDAAPVVVYDLVADVTGVGRISPECVDASWSAGVPGEVGSQFVGRNVVGQSTWSMACEVVAATRPDVFSWRVLTEAVTPETSVWTFTFDVDDGGTQVTETFAMAEPPTGLQASLVRHGPDALETLIELRKARLTVGIETTLANLKALAERTSPQTDPQQASG